MKRRYAVAAAMVAATMLLAGCTAAKSGGNSASASNDPATSSVSHSNQKYIYVGAANNLEYFNALKYGWKKAGEDFGVQTSYVGPAADDVNAEASAFQQAIAEKPAGIAVWAQDPVLTPLINQAAKAGIPVVTTIGDLPDSDRISYVGSDNEEDGYTGGMALAKAIHGHGQVALLSIPGTSSFDQRAAGYKKALAKYPGIKIVQVGNTQADTTTAASVASAILQRYPNLAAFGCTDSTGGIGSATAVQEAGKVGKVKIISQDRNADVLKLIQNGSVTGTVAQDDSGISYWAMEALYNYVNHQSALTSNQTAARASGVVNGPTDIYLHTNFVDKANVKYFLDQDKVYAQ